MMKRAFGFHGHLHIHFTLTSDHLYGRFLHQTNDREFSSILVNRAQKVTWRRQRKLIHDERRVNGTSYTVMGDNGQIVVITWGLEDRTG